MTVILMISFARSGGTILNQCLGSIPGVVMLSEVNPMGGGWGKLKGNSATSVKAQALEWYKIDLQTEDYLESILELESICEKQGDHLIIREWTYPNYFPHQVNSFDPPDKLLTYEVLNPHCKLIPFVFVRDAIDVWISRGMPPPDLFFKRYLKYIEDIKDIAIYRYEEFCDSPERIIRDICNHTGIPYSESWRDYQNNIFVHGDVQTRVLSRGRRQRDIKPLPRRRIPKQMIEEVNHNIDMKKANDILSYPGSYFGREQESLVEYVKNRMLKSRYLSWL